MTCLFPVEISIVNTLDSIARAVTNKTGFSRSQRFQGYQAFLNLKAAKTSTDHWRQLLPIELVLCRRELKESSIIEQFENQIDKVEKSSEYHEAYLFFILALRQLPNVIRKVEEDFTFGIPSLLPSTQWRAQEPMPFTFEAVLKNGSFVPKKIDPISYKNESTIPWPNQYIDHEDDDTELSESSDIKNFGQKLNRKKVAELFACASWDHYLRVGGSPPKSSLILTLSDLQTYTKFILMGTESDLFSYNVLNDCFECTILVTLEDLCAETFRKCYNVILEGGKWSRKLLNLINYDKPLCRTVQSFTLAIGDLYSAIMKHMISLVDQSSSFISLIIHLKPILQWLCYFGYIVDDLLTSLQSSNGNDHICLLWNSLVSRCAFYQDENSALSFSFVFCLEKCLIPLFKTFETALDEHAWKDPFDEFSWIKCTLFNRDDDSFEIPLDFLYYQTPADMPPLIDSLIRDLVVQLKSFHMLKNSDFDFQVELPFLNWKNKCTLVENFDFPSVSSNSSFVQDLFSSKQHNEVCKMEKFTFHYLVREKRLEAVFEFVSHIYMNFNCSYSIRDCMEQSLFQYIMEKKETVVVVDPVFIVDIQRRLVDHCVAQNIPVRVRFGWSAKCLLDLSDPTTFESMAPEVILTWYLRNIISKQSMLLYKQIWVHFSYLNLVLFMAMQTRKSLNDKTVDSTLRRSLLYLNIVYRLACEIEFFYLDQCNVECKKFIDIIKLTTCADNIRRSHCAFLENIYGLCCMNESKTPGLHRRIEKTLRVAIQICAAIFQEKHDEARQYFFEMAECCVLFCKELQGSSLSRNHHVTILLSYLKATFFRDVS